MPALRAAVRKELQKLEAMCPASPFVMLTSLAEGADQLCAEEALAEGFALSAALPMPLAEYEKDFSEDGRLKLYALLENARDMFVCRASEPAGEGRHFLFRQAGIYIAEHSHVLLALWDGKQGRPGGTAETVEMKLHRAFDEKSEESLHPDNGCVIHVHTGRASGEPCAEAGKTDFLGNEIWLREVLAETDLFNAEADKLRIAEAAALPDMTKPADAGLSASTVESPADTAEPTEDPVMERVRQIYHTADTLGIENAVRFKQILKGLSAAAAFLTIAFLLYDEAELYWMILLCGFMLLALVAIRMIAKKLRCHSKYLEYRIFAEGLRVEQYLRTAGLATEAAELFPWSLQINVPWIKEACEAAVIGSTSQKKESILDSWVRDQKNYHYSAGKKTQVQIRRNDRIVRIALILSVLAYAAALIFEIRFGFSSGPAKLPEAQIGLFRTILKILLGSLSASTLFAGNYYGKLSLEETAEDHARMLRLYETAEQKILAEGENPELLLKLAKEELGENSSWYAYQSMNKPEISL